MRHYLTLACVAVLLLASACSRSSEPTPTTSAAAAVDSVAEGRLIYRAYCMSCHGGSAHGDGPVAAYLKVPVPDLARISLRHNGTFPDELVLSTIVGTREVRAHGTRAMPVFGNIWGDDGKGGLLNNTQIQDRTRYLLAYLKSVQTNEPAPAPADTMNRAAR